MREGGADHLLLERERTSALNREHHSGERRHLLLVRGREGLGGWGNIQRVYRNQIFVLLVSTISDTSVEIFVLLSCTGFLSITTDIFTLTKISNVNCAS